MKSRAGLLILVVLVLLAAGLSSARAAEQPATPSPLFIENMGQFAEGARFMAHGAGRAFWLADDAVWITLLEPAEERPLNMSVASAGRPTAERAGDTPRRGVNLRLTFPGANPQAELIAYEPVQTTISYFLGSDPAGWRPAVPVWAGVRYRDLYPDLDLVWDSAGARAGLRFICRAADCSAALANVRLRVDGADALSRDGDALLIAAAGGEYRLPLPIVQDAAGHPLSLASVSPGLQGDTLTAPFAHADAGAGANAPADDPDDLLYSTFLGGGTDERAINLAVDATGNATVVGFTFSIGFPTTPGAFDSDFNGYYDVFVSRLNAAGSALIYSTFLGGEGYDEGSGLALDDAGNATLIGLTGSPDFPTTPGAFDTTINGDGDAFVARLNAAGDDLIYSTFLGGNTDDFGHSVALDPAGRATVTGDTLSGNFPTTPGAFDTTHNGLQDVFVTRLNVSGSNLLFSTYLGGNDYDNPTSVVLDGAGNAALLGYTSSTNFPTTPGAFDTGYNGSGDAFVARLNNAGDALIYSTFFGGSGAEHLTGDSLASDAAGNVAFAGGTSSPDLPTTPGAFDSSFNGLVDAFVGRLNAAGNDLLYSTFMGGVNWDSAYGLELDAAGNTTLTGFTSSYNFPTTPGAFDTGFNSVADVFVSRLNAAGSDLLYSTFLGGGNDDHGYGLALGDSEDAYVAGNTSGQGFPTTPGAFDRSHNGFLDVFVARLNLEEPTDVGLSAVGGQANTHLDAFLSAGVLVGALTFVLLVAGWRRRTSTIDSLGG